MNKKILTLLMIGMVGLPMAAAANTLENQGVVTGHTVYANMGGFDPDIAAIAGLAESKVVWFNGQTIFSTLGDGFVYAVDAGSPCSPLGGSDYAFHDYDLSYRDPNNQTHIVAHYTYKCGDANLADPLGNTLNQTHHVWVTLTHAKETDFPITTGDAGRTYNFALAVDTSFMDREEDGEAHGGADGPPSGQTTSEINEGNSYCAQENDHVCNGGTVDGEDGVDGHAHNTAEVSLYFSKTDRGIGANLAGGPGTHPGTEAGCASDANCAAVTDPNSSYEDPTGAS